MRYGKFESYDGIEITRIGIGRNEKDQEVVVIVDQDENLRLIPKDFFEGNVLLLNKGFVKRYEQVV